MNCFRLALTLLRDLVEAEPKEGMMCAIMQSNLLSVDPDLYCKTNNKDAGSCMHDGGREDCVQMGENPSVVP